jgi:hypothetical protein
MNLDPNEVGYFITQVADAAMSFGVSAEDLAPVGMALNSLFGYRCAPATTVIPAQGVQLQSICQAEECPIAPNSTCDGVADSVEPAMATGDNAMATPTSSGTASSPTSTSVVVNGASALGMSIFAVFGGLVALCL